MFGDRLRKFNNESSTNAPSIWSSAKIGVERISSRLGASGDAVSSNFQHRSCFSDTQSLQKWKADFVKADLFMRVGLVHRNIARYKILGLPKNAR